MAMTADEIKGLARQKAVDQVQKESLDGVIKSEDVVARQEELTKKYIAELEAENGSGLGGFNSSRCF